MSRREFTGFIPIKRNQRQNGPNHSDTAVAEKEESMFRPLNLPGGTRENRAMSIKPE